MNTQSEFRRLFWLISTMILLLAQTSITVAAIHPTSHKDLMDRITSIATQDTGAATALIIQGNGNIPDLTTRTIPYPPRIIVDILHGVPPFKSMFKRVSSPTLKSVRVGYHPTSIRLVLDVNGNEVPHFSTASKENRLVITLHTEDSDNNENPSSLHAQGRKEETDTAAYEDKVAIDTQESKQKTTTIADATVVKQDTIKTSSFSQNGMLNAAEQLIQVAASEDPGTISAYGNAIDAYESRNWLAAVNRLTRFLETSPPDTYAEKASFLMAKASDHLYSDTLLTHFNDIKRQYEDAIYRYPDSIYTADAYLSIGDLCFRAKIYSEALGYCNFVIEMDKPVKATPRAMILKGNILSMKNDKDEALAIYRTIQQRYPGSSEAVQSKIETAKILFELNQFQRSLDLLSALSETHEYMYRYPDISRYFGDNLYQLGHFTKAKEHLFRYYNICPDKQDSHLILARIADAYREEGDWESATRFYQLVLERYPETEGALISVYRLADQQEKGEVEKKAGVAPNFKIIGSDVDMPRKIYEDVIQTALDKDETSPLTQYALLKLSRLDLKEKKYASSLNRLKNLIETYPRTKLRKEIEHTYAETLLSILQKDYKIKKYKHIINTFLAEENNITNLKSSQIFIIIARSALQLNLEDMAVEMFKKALPYTADAEKPPDLLFSLARYFYENGKMESASSYADLLIKNYPEDKTIPGAYLIKGDILSSLKNYTQASVMFSSALERGSMRCDQPAIQIQRAKALIALGSDEPAYQAVSAADKIGRDCSNVDQQVFEEIGNLYIQFGHPQEALSVFKFAHDMDGDEKHRSKLKMMMARCHEIMNNKESYLALYNEVADQNDPFWGNVAKEKIEEMNFKPVVRKDKN